MKYFVYKIYRIALGNEYENPIFNFLILIFLFELYHIMFVGIAVRLITGFHILETQTGSLFVVIGLIFIYIVNYLYFIRRKKIFRINDYYQNRESKGWKGNLLFVLYWLFLSLLLYIEGYLFDHGYCPILD